MKLRQTIARVHQSIPRYHAQFEAGRERRAALQEFKAATDVVVFLRKLAAKGHDRRFALVAALVEEHRASRVNLWQSMLVVVFEPFLCRVRRALGNVDDEDLDQTVLLAFLEALSAASLDSMLPIVAIEREMFTALTRLMQPEKVARRVVPPARPRAFSVEGRLEVRDAVRVLVELAGGNQEIVDVVLDTVFGAETLTEHVARVHPEMGEATRALVTRRLRRERAVMIARMNARVTGGAIVPTQTPH